MGKSKDTKPVVTVESEDTVLTPEQVKAGWFVSEWGEVRPPTVEVSNEVEDPYLKEGK